MKFDFHIHSKYSYDSLMSPKKIVKLYEQKGFDCIAITDHDCIDGALEAKKFENSRITVIVGEEISTDYGDLIAIGLSQKIPTNNFFEVIKEIKKQNAISILPHPYKGHRDVEIIAEYVDFIEVFNARTDPELNKKARILAQKLNKPTIYGSDAHVYSEIGNAINVGTFVGDTLIIKNGIGFQSTQTSVILSQIVKSLKMRRIKQFMMNILSYLMTTMSSLIHCCLGFCYNILLKITHDIFLNKLNTKKLSGDILFSSYLISWRDYRHRNGKNYAYDLMIGDVLEECSKTKTTVCIDKNNLPFFQMLALRREKLVRSNEWVCSEKYLKYRDLADTFIEICFPGSISQSSKKYDDFFTTIGMRKFFSSVLSLKICENIITSIAPKIVVVTCEYCGFNRELSYVAHKHNIPVFALQHGVIPESHFGYIYSDRDMQKIIPDFTCVFGPEIKDILTTRSIYNPTQVLVTGNPRYDIFPHMDDIYNKEQFLKRYNIGKNCKIVLWTTQCHGLSDEENKRNFKAMFGTLQSLKEVTLILKQHPGEGKKYIRMIKEVLKDYDINAIMMSKDSDTYEQLYVCDLMITKDSTTAMEAVALDKPVIVLNLSGKPDEMNYVEEGVALGVYKENDLKITIEKLLEDNSELADKREKFIEKYMYKIDGKSTERVVQLIEEMVEKKNYQARKDNI